MKKVAERLVDLEAKWLEEGVVKNSESLLSSSLLLSPDAESVATAGGLSQNDDSHDGSLLFYCICMLCC